MLVVLVVVDFKSHIRILEVLHPVALLAIVEVGKLFCPQKS